MKLRIDVLGPPLTNKEVADFEHEIGWKLPPEYRHFLLNHNGGRPQPADFRHRILGQDSTNCVTEFLPLLKSPNNDLRELWTDAQAVLPKGFLPFARDLGMELICFLMKGKNAGAIYRSDGFVEDIGRPAEMHYLADSFPAFLGMLFDEATSRPRDPVEELASKGKLKDLHKYLKSGGSFSDQAAWGGNIVQTAAATGNLEVIKACLELGADRSGALAIAIYNHQWEMMRYLVAAGADVNEVWPKTGKRPLQALCGVFGTKRDEIENFLKAHGAK
jgi:hypothetical protein